MRRLITLAILSAFVFAACLARAEPIKLAYKFTKGELDKMRMNMSMTMSMPGMPGAENMPPMSMSMEMVARQRTLDVLPDGSARIRVTYSAPSVKVSGGGKTKKPALPQTSTIIMTMSPDGRVTNVEGMEKMLAASGLKNFDMTPFTNLMGSYAFFPAEPVEVGSSWQNRIPIPFTGGDMAIDSTLQSYPEQIWALAAARISQKYSARIDIGQMVQSLAGSLAKTAKDRQAISQVSGNVDLNGSMDFLFAPSIGKLLKGSGQMWGTVKVNLPPDAIGAGVPGEMCMDMTMKMSMTRFR